MNQLIVDSLMNIWLKVCFTIPLVVHINFDMYSYTNFLGINARQIQLTNSGKHVANPKPLINAGIPNTSCKLGGLP